MKPPRVGQLTARERQKECGADRISQVSDRAVIAFTVARAGRALGVRDLIAATRRYT